MLKLCHYSVNLSTSDPGLEKSTISLIFRIFPHVSPDAGFYSKSVQKAPVLLHGYVTSFVRGVWPLKPAVAQAKRKQAESYALKEQAFDAILFHATEEEQRSLFQGIQAVCQANHGSQAVNTPAEIYAPTSYYNSFDTCRFPKHAESPTGS